MPYLPWLFPHLVAPGSDGRARLLTSGPRFGGSVHVVPRGLCQYSRKPMPRTDAKGREAARQQARFESRFPDPSVIALSDEGSSKPGEVVVWTWDRARLELLTDKKNPRALPETLAREGMGTGVRLVEGLDGYEGEIWVDSELVATRWWREPPARDAWLEFLLGARTQFPGADLWDMQLTESPPEPQRPVWKSDLAWVDDNWRTSLARMTPARLAVIVGVMALAPAGCHTARLAKLSADSYSLSVAVAEGQAQAGEWLAQRRRAQRDAQQAFDAAALGDDAGVLHALLDLGSVLEGQGVVIAQVRYIEGEMQAALSGAPRDPLAKLIGALEDSPYWQDVRMESGPFRVIGRLESPGARTDAVSPGSPAPPTTGAER